MGHDGTNPVHRAAPGTLHTRHVDTRTAAQAQHDSDTRPSVRSALVLKSRGRDLPYVTPEQRGALFFTRFQICPTLKRGAPRRRVGQTWWWPKPSGERRRGSAMAGARGPGHGELTPQQSPPAGAAPYLPGSRLLFVFGGRRA